ncbi:MAG: hypothetical protein VST67_01165 [Nitrospirota bacterium]|nr:hypothetical protein [Nitrospirota bacterium]
MEAVNTQSLLSQMLLIELVIPAWQMALFIVTISVFMLIQRIKLTLIITFLFTFYWAFFLYWGDVLASFAKFPFVAALYLVSGVIYIVLTLIAFYRETH